jgi:tetratricopeptide (TPR) repeat protein
MFIAKLNVAAATLLALSLLGAGTVFALGQGRQPYPPALAQEEPPQPDKDNAAKAPAPAVIPTATLLAQAAEALKTGSANGSDSRRFLEQLGVLRARDGDLKGAREAFAGAEKITQRFPPAQQANAWRELAEAQVDAGEVEAGLDTAGRIEGDLKKFTLHRIAAALARSGNFKEAQRVANKVEDAEEREYTFVDIARARAEAGDMMAALGIAESIKKPIIRVLALIGNEHSTTGGIALVQAKSGDRAAAHETLRRGIAIAETIESGPAPGRVWAWVARAEARMGDFTAAHRTADRAPVEEEMPRIGAYYSRDLALQEIAKAEAEAGRIDDALKTARTIKSSLCHVTALCAVAEARAKAGLRDSSRTVFAEAVKVAEGAEDRNNRNPILFIVITVAQEAAGDFDAADKTSTRVGEGNSTPVRQGIAVARAMHGDFDGALAYLVHLKNEEFAPPGPRQRLGRALYESQRPTTLEKIARLQTEAGDERAVLARAEAEAAPLAKAATLLGVVEGRAKRKEKPSAKQ